MKSKHWDQQQIEAFLSGDHSNLSEKAMHQLESCADFRRQFDQAAAAPKWWNEAQQMLAPSQFDFASTAEYSAGGHSESRASTSFIQNVLDSLSPTDDPNSLGRMNAYEITGVIGSGNMGVVLKAIDPPLERVVAVKVMAPHLANNATARKRFAREAKAAAAVIHPNVIPIHAVSKEDEPSPFLVMAYIRGGSLQKRIETEGPLSITAILRIGSQIAAGLAAAHDQGLVHRDIKPENILLEEGVERVTLTDFGLARAVDDASVTQHGLIAGTPQFMSPEQARGESVDQKSDLFSLGSVLYTLCTGRPPFSGESSYGVMRRTIDESPSPIRDLNPQIPAWLCQIVEKLMAKDKTERFQSAAEVHKLLESCLSHVQQPVAFPLPESLRQSDPAMARSQSNRTEPVKPAKPKPVQPSQSVFDRRTIVIMAVASLIVMVPLLAFLSTRWMDSNSVPATWPSGTMIGGGVATSDSDWWFSDGHLYIKPDEPGLLMGMHETPSGEKSVTYVVLFKHAVGSTAVSVVHPKDSGLTFDGKVAKSKSGVTIEGRGFEIGVQQSPDRLTNGIGITQIQINGNSFDPAKGRLFLVDLTTGKLSEVVEVTQVDVPLPHPMPTPREVIKTTSSFAPFCTDLIDKLLLDSQVNDFVDGRFNVSVTNR